MGEVDAPVVRVELFEDRAAITRTVELSGPGRHRLSLGPVTPLVSERTITFPGGTEAILEEIRIERIRSTRRQADPEAIAPLERAWRTASDRAAAADGALTRSHEAIARHRAALDTAVDASPRGLLHAPPEAWVEMVDALAADLARAQEEATSLAIAARFRREEAAGASHDLALARQGRPLVHAILHLSVVAEAAGTLAVRYVVPCAVWRPAHRATLTTDHDGPPRVAWELTAVCWNATGEDWTDVELVCSTARPGDRAEPPELIDDVVWTQKRSTQVVVAARDETIARARDGGRAAPPELPGVDDGGEPRTFPAPDPVTLPSDGRPVSVRLDGWTAEGHARWIALPEQAGTAVLRTIQVHPGPRPLLAGPVALVRDGMAVGRAQIGLVPPGEPFPLGWGSHDGIRISRRRDHEVDRKRFSGRQLHLFTIEIRVSHVGASPCALDVRERVPTSELKEVRIRGIEATPPLGTGPDADGFCTWSLQLEPGDRQQLTLSWTVDAASNVVLPFG